MINKILFLTLLLFNCSYASYQELRIGTIDDYYANKITRDELRNMIDEIEDIFETELNMNIFDYSSSGKKINLIYVPPSKLERKISQKFAKVKIKKDKISKLQSSFFKKQKEIDRLKKQFKIDNSFFKEQVGSLNEYIKEVNKQKRLSRDEYNSVKKYTKKEKDKISKARKILQKEQSNIQRVVNKYNNKIYVYRNLISEHNRLNKEIESMNRNFKKLKGMTFSSKEVTEKVFYKNGKKVKERSVKSTMKKIEIYGFDNLNELKVVLAHEIAHLVGIPHIEVAGALMHPIVQKSQISNLNLTEEDIINFQDNF